MSVMTVHACEATSQDPFAMVLGTARGDAKRNRLLTISVSNEELLWVTDKDQVYEEKAEHVLTKLRVKMEGGSFFEVASLLNEGHKTHKLTSKNLKDFPYIQRLLWEMVALQQEPRFAELKTTLYGGIEALTDFKPWHAEISQMVSNIREDLDNYFYPLAANRVAKGLLQSNAKSFWDASVVRTVFTSYY